MFETPKVIPTGPIHCRACGCELEPLRRWGGECRACVAGRHSGVEHRVSDETVVPQWTIVERYRHRRPDGVREWYLRVRCDCGTERVMSVSDFDRKKSIRCNACRLAGIRASGGVESDYAK